MTQISKIELDPFRAILGVLMGLNDSDKLTNLVSATGLQFDMSLTEAEAYSHKTRARAYQPRIINAYSHLDDQQKLAVSDAVITAILLKQDDVYPHVAEILQKIGWGISDDEKLVATKPDLREMFFPKGSPWDAFVVIRDLFSEAKNELIIVDAYCDGTVFQMLSPNILSTFRVNILCSKHAPAVATEAKAFILQHPSIVIEVRQTRDFHDRFIVIDGQSCVHIGASIKDAGKTAFMINRIEDQQNKDSLLQNINNSWNAATIIL
jgi:hypothetical protein